MLRVLACAFAVQLMPLAALAQCGEHEKMTTELVNKWGEIVAGTGQSEHGLIEHWVSPDTGTWTMLVVSPEGRACVVAYGEAWQFGGQTKVRGEAL